MIPRRGRFRYSPRTSGQLPAPISGVGRCSTADESHAEPHAPITTGLPVTRAQFSGPSTQPGLSLHSIPPKIPFTLFLLKIIYGSRRIHGRVWVFPRHSLV